MAWQRHTQDTTADRETSQRGQSPGRGSQHLPLIEEVSLGGTDSLAGVLALMPVALYLLAWALIGRRLPWQSALIALANAVVLGIMVAALARRAQADDSR